MSLPLAPEHPWLAPLAGFTDLPFRLVCRKYGCKVAFTEMISAKGLIYNNTNTSLLLQTCSQDVPLVVQLFGSHPKDIVNAVLCLQKKGFFYFDLNCGCSVKKVVKTGAGAALLKNPSQIVQIFKALHEYVPPQNTGIKTRLGYDLNTSTYLELAENLAALNIGWFTLHPRYAREKFSGQARWEHLANLKKLFPELKVIGSGDLFTAQDGLNCLHQTKIDGIMFARGALSNPYIFREFKLLLEGKDISQLNKKKLIAEILEDFVFYYQQYAPQSIKKMRTILPKMIKNIPEAKKMRVKLSFLNSWEEVREMINLFKGESNG
ncbi:MAG: tRNA-dihydrouridine synthase family protein [Desulfonauticus sp.]|nr:tRNA-dihydrouridine synthase family protein [Desulfonauticus sp.]